MPPVERKRAPKRFAEWEDKPVKDYDPENEAPSDNGESGSEESGDDRAGTEHYVSVGKSKLRQKEAVSLGPEYRGARVSRAALDESSESEDDGEEGSEDGSDGEEYDDPDTADLEADHIDDDAEIDSDEAFGESDEEKLKHFNFVGSKSKRAENGRIKKRPTAADFMSQSDEEGGEEDDEDDEELSGDEDESELEREGAMLFDDEAEESSGEEDDDEEDDDDDEGSDGMEDEDDEDEDEDDEDENEDDEDGDKDNGDDEHADLKRIMGEGQKAIVDTMSQKAKEDAAKGAAIRVQRRAFDSILNLRIRLQKAMVATNTFNMVESSESPSKPYQAAEEAAVKLWNTIDSVRHSFLPEGKAKAGMKRKRIELDTSSQDIWDSMQEIEKAATAHRRKVLDKWSSRVRSASAAVSTRRLVDNANQTLLAVLDDQMVASDRLVKKARAPRSCAPAQAAKKVEEDREIYDDADFYQLLLKELVDQRSLDTGAPGESIPTVRWAALKEAKTRKQVDRKASKGRKLRFTVHEKLQSFMAPEDRRQWEEHAIDRFFGTLFGQKMVLKEEENVSDEGMGGTNVEEDGLRLFRS
ncbi:hypothetical protein OQA88_9658 [Cercophora sp. LCS_1]